MPRAPRRRRCPFCQTLFRPHPRARAAAVDLRGARLSAAAPCGELSAGGGGGTGP